MAIKFVEESISGKDEAENSLAAMRSTRLGISWGKAFFFKRKKPCGQRKDYRRTGSSDDIRF